MESISYKTVSEGRTVEVRIGRSLMGRIKQVRGGWHYWPVSGRTPGETFPTLEDCKRSLEDPGPEE